MKTLLNKENGMLVIAIMLFIIFKSIGVGLIFLTFYLGILAIYFFPIRLLFTKENNTKLRILTSITIAFTLTLSGIKMHLDKPIIDVSFLSFIATFTCIFLFVYYLNKNSKPIATTVFLAKVILGLMIVV